MVAWLVSLCDISASYSPCFKMAMTCSSPCRVPFTAVLLSGSADGGQRGCYARRRFHDFRRRLWHSLRDDGRQKAVPASGDCLDIYRLVGVVVQRGPNLLDALV